METIAVTYHNDLAAADDKIKKHEPLLHKIAASLGFSDPESCVLVQQVCLKAYKNDALGKICYPMKVWLVKDLVHQCIFIISRRLFSQQNMDAGTMKWDFRNGYYLQEMPLSYRVVYILNLMFSFNEIEVAEILNITPVKVKERLHKTFAFMKEHQLAHLYENR